MKLYHILLTLLIFFCHLPAIHAQKPAEAVTFHAFSTPEGLPNSMVHEVYQDRDGFLWIATFYGLYRYDGYELQTYKSNLYTPGLLVNNNVLCVTEDYAHRLWIGTHEGLCILDKTTGDLRRMQLAGVNKHRLNTIHVTQDSCVYLGYIRGMAYYDARQDTLIRMTRANCRGEVPENINIQTILEDGHGNLLIGTWDNGLYRYLPQTNEFIHYNPDNLPRTVLSLFQDSRGNTWLGSYGNGLYRIGFSTDRRSLTVIKQFLHPEDAPSTSPANYIYSIHEDLHTHTLWLGTREGVSLLPLDRQADTFIRYHEGDPLHYLPAHEVNSVMRDANGLMWIGTKGAGIFHADTRPRLFHTLQPQDTPVTHTNYVSTVYIDKHGGQWTGLDYGVTYLSAGRQVSLLPDKRPYHISHSRSTGCMMLAVHDEGLLACQDGKVIRRYRKDNCDFIPHNLVYAMHEDRKGRWWIASYHGLGVRCRDGKGYCLNRLPGTDPLLSREITSITEAPDHSLWLTTENHGVIHLTGEPEHPETLTCRNYSFANKGLPVNTPLCLFIDREHRIWAGTEGSGLCLYDPQEDIFNSVHRACNLPGDMVGSIETDAQGHLWLGTNQGLARLTLTDGQPAGIRIFTTADGLPDNFFNRNASFSHDGRLYFGCSRGLVTFDPSSLDENPAHIPLHFTDIVVNGTSWQQLSSSDRRALTAHTPDFARELTIPTRYTDFALRFAALTYHQPERNRYAYRLSGFEDDWHYTDASTRQAYYSNLDPGRYTLEVQAINANGDRSQIRTLPIHVETPLWATWWAYLIYIGIGAGIATALVYEARRKMHLRNRLHLQELETAKIQELNHVKLQFFTNITHELMTPLTILSASVDELKNQYPSLAPLYRTMDVNIQRLIRLLQQILEFRKAESGNLQLRVSPGDLSGFIRREVESFAPLTNRRRQHLTATCEALCMPACFDTDKVDKIIYNLLSNAAKYGREGGNIRVTLCYAHEGEHIILTVEDDGEGISAEQQKTLFKRFYEGDYRRHHTIGTGIGLSLTRDLVLLHHGTIKVESQPGQGTRFIVTLPVSAEAYADHERQSDAPDSQDRIIDMPAGHTTVTDTPPSPDAPCLLLVEDNEDLLDIMRRLLGHTYHIRTAAHGQEALQILEAESIALVVSDVVMPVMDGLELTRHIKEDRNLCHTPVILLTARQAEESRGEGYTAGADAYLTKPFHLSTLHARIDNLLKQRARTAGDFKQQLAIEIKDLHYTDLDEKFLQDAITCINQHLEDADFDIPGFAAELSVSRTTLHKKLTALTGMNTSSFIRNIRLKAACRLMDENRHIRISELAYRVGFNDPKYFSSCFKREFGLQPSEYLEQKHT